MIQPPTNSNNKILLYGLRNGYITCFILIIAAYLFLFLFTYNSGFAPAHKVGDWSLSGFELIFVCPAFILELLGIFWFRLFRFGKQKKTSYDLWNAEFARIAMTLSGPVCGYIVRIAGGGWHVVTFLYILSILALIITFPTSKRISKWGISRNESDST